MQYIEDEAEYDLLERYNNQVMIVLTKFWGSSQKGDCERLAELIGDPFCDSTERRYIVDITKPEVRATLDALLGPNGRTIMKMLEIRAEDRNGK